MLRKGSWTTTDLQTVAARLPAMREVEKIWRDLASRAREATRERKRGTSADSADPADPVGGVKRRRLSWPGVGADQAASVSVGGERGGAGPEAANPGGFGGPASGRIASSPAGQPDPDPDAIEPAAPLQPALVPAASGGETVAGGEAPAAGTGSAQERPVAEGQPATAAPDAGAGTVRDISRIPVGQWTQEELRRAIAEAEELELSSDEKDAAGQIVRFTHDVVALARGMRSCR
ncbi:hypothetical protein [Saccharopolyspora sp. ASAGF58]|uniref:hypothetical protein n=1 Tax=Saccharopolyspora sp. ASAGF58 TaxID=2719023 RepID=UPI001B3180B3|nr:hypothetical protein [Saccharopolyspora sp. ASAGF58]